jgi:hypothetical protein
MGIILVSASLKQDVPRNRNYQQAQERDTNINIHIGKMGNGEE